MLNKSKGNMYPWVTHTWNAVKGKCPHDCSYCYMKRYPQKACRVDGMELDTDLGKGNFIFVGSSCDMWANGIPTMWIEDILRHCIEFENRYLFQTKNPDRFMNFFTFPNQILLATTIETNRQIDGISKAPKTWERMMAMEALSGEKMVSIEPVMDFDTDVFVQWLKRIQPEFVSIGADSGNNNLPEPPTTKVQQLIKELRSFTTVKVKDNLKRLLR